MTSYTIEKHTGSFGGGGFRMQIKAFKYSEDMYTFLGKQEDNSWKVSSKDLKSGTYAMAGGTWQNIKSLSASLRCHV